MLNSLHQTEDKLIILYVLNKIKTGITREQLAYIIIQNVQISYFDIQLYIDELINEKLILESQNSDDKIVLVNSFDGDATLEQLVDKIPAFIQEMLALYIEQSRSMIYKEVHTTANYKEISPDNFQVALTLSENGTSLMSINVYSPTKEEAIAMCQKWQKNTQKLYASIIKDLT